MENNFKELKQAVVELHNKTADAIVDLLEEYNLKLSTFFAKREITRGFLELFDAELTLESIKEKFEATDRNSLSIQQLVTDLNTLARSTWYFEREDGKILTGQDLYENKAVYLASITVTEPIYKNEEEKKLAEEAEEKEPYGFRDIKGNEVIIREVPPLPIGHTEVVKNIVGEEKVSSIEEMVQLIKFHSIVLQRFLKEA